MVVEKLVNCVFNVPPVNIGKSRDGSHIAIAFSEHKNANPAPNPASTLYSVKYCSDVESVAISKPIENKNVLPSITFLIPSLSIRIPAGNCDAT